MLSAYSSYAPTADNLCLVLAGWINKNYIQLGYQVADTVAIFSYAFVMTMLILIVLDYIPGLSLRVSEEGEMLGLDEDQIGEWGYDWQHIVGKESIGHSEGPSASLSSPTASMHHEKKQNAASFEPSNEREATAPVNDSHV